jgi:tRNA A-37 threonylcarbamoyl transferase component Bud32
MGFGDMLKKTFNDGKDLAKINIELEKKKLTVSKTIFSQFNDTGDFNKEDIMVILKEIKELEEQKSDKKDDFKSTIQEGKNNIMDKANEAKSKMSEIKNKNKKVEEERTKE